MTLRETIAHLRKSPADGWYYIQGSIRLIAYRNRFAKRLLRRHIVEQFEWRRDVAANKCYKAGQCYCCECKTPDVFFATKACSALKIWHCQDEEVPQCYGELLNKREWRSFKTTKQ